MRSSEKVDLTPFKELEGQKIPWTDRLSLIESVFPSTTTLNWKGLFDEDPGMFGDLINDIIKADQASPGRPGKRAAVEPEIAMARFQTFMGDDYSSDDFKGAFKQLVGKRSTRHVSARTGLHRTMIQRLLTGRYTPNVETMESIARSFGKEPAYFLEYRIQWIAGLVALRLSQNPESSVVFYRKINEIGKHGS